jgi:hypothetical protein
VQSFRGAETASLDLEINGQRKADEKTQMIETSLAEWAAGKEHRR